jgi:hypothetical protein
MDIDEGTVGEVGTDAILLEAAKRLVLVSLPEIPGYLPQTAGSHPTEEERGTGLEQPGKTSGKPVEVRNAVQCAEVRKRSIEQLLWVQRGDIFGAKRSRAHKSLQSALPDSARRNLDHLRRWIASQDFYTAFSQETRIHASAASDLQSAVAGVKSFREFAPHRGALRPADA